MNQGENLSNISFFGPGISLVVPRLGEFRGSVVVSGSRLCGKSFKLSFNGVQKCLVDQVRQADSISLNRIKDGQKCLDIG